MRSMTRRSGGISSAGDRRLVAVEADRRGVHEHLRLRQLGLDDRLVPGHRPQLHVGRAPGEEADQRLGPMEVAVEDDDPLEALGDQPVDDGAGAAAGAEDHGGARHPLLPDEGLEGDAEARHVGVVADEALALAGDRVDGAGGVRLLGQAVDEAGRLLLVGDRDVRPQERRRSAARRSRRRAPAAPGPTARRWPGCRPRRTPPAASRRRASGRPDGR